MADGPHLLRLCLSLVPGGPPSWGLKTTGKCLSGGDFLLWKSEFAEQCQNTLEINQAHCRETAQQLDFDRAVYDPVDVAAKKAWDELHRAD